MPIKGMIQDDHIPVNKYQLIVPGLPDLTLTTVGGIEEELEVAEMPDRSMRPGGTTKAVEFTATQPAHHTSEIAAMEAWFAECQDPVTPTCRKAGTLLMQSGTGATIRSFSLVNLFPFKRATPDLDMANEGEAALLTWTFKADTILPA